MVSTSWYPPLPTVPLSSTQESNISATISSMPTATSVTYHTMEPVTSTEVQESPYTQNPYLTCESQLLEYGNIFEIFCQYFLTFSTNFQAKERR